MIKSFASIRNMKKMALIPIFIMALLSVCKAFGDDSPSLLKPEIKMIVLADKSTCWTFYESIKTISHLKLANTRLVVQMLISSDNKSTIDNIKQLYDIDCEIYLDPLSLYAKEFKFKNLPAIILYNTNGEVELKEEWGSPAKYENRIKELDQNCTELNAPKINGLKHVKTIAIRDENKQIIHNFSSYFNGAINLQKQLYYLPDNKQKSINVFDSSGKIIDKIILPCDSIICNQPYFFNLIGDSVLTWIDFSLKGASEYYCLNLNSKKLQARFSHNSCKISDTSMIASNLYKIDKSSNYIAQIQYFGNIYLTDNNKSLILLDSNFNIIKYFGSYDPVFQTMKMSRFVSGGLLLTCDNNSNLYTLSQASNRVYKYDIKANSNGYFDLKFDSSFKKNIIDYPSKVSREQVLEYRLKNSIIGNIFCDNNVITVQYSNTYNNGTSNITRHYLDRFDSTGKRLMISALEFPPNWIPLLVENKKIVLYNENRSELLFYCYEIEN